MINLNLSAIRTNKDRVGIMCHTPEQLGKVCDILGYKFEQSKFETVILSTRMFATVHPTANGYIFVQAPDFIAANPPLFTSEDGVPMYPDSLCWTWNEVTQQYSNLHGKPTNQLGKHTYDGSTPSWKLFSTKEARDGYARKNKVYLTTNDGVKIKLGDTYWFIRKESGGINRGVESGIITHTNDFVYFSTYEKAKEYVEKQRKYLYDLNQEEIRKLYTNTLKGMKESEKTKSDIVGFMNWLAENGWKSSQPKWSNPNNEGLTSDELYELWKENNK